MNLRKYSPVLRAVGIVGVVAGLVTAVTFAQLTSSTVVLADNTLTADSANIAIGTGVAIATPSTCTAASSSAPGLSAPSFKPGDTATVNFCLQNSSDFAQTLTATIPQTPMGSDAAAATTFTITCATEGPLTSNLNTWGPGTFGAPIPAHSSDACTATATLSAAYNGSGVNTIPTFNVNFVGTQVE